MSAPRDLFAAVQREFHVAEFVETGTYLGDTTVWASAHFPHVTTIERSPDIHRKTSARYADRRNVTFLLGDSRERLQETAPGIEGPAVFWLDAHFSGGMTAGSGDECPLIDELAIINADDPENRYVFIDDARHVMGPAMPPLSPEQWPTLRMVFDALAAPGHDPYIAIVDDVIISVPQHARTFVVDYLRRTRKENFARTYLSRDLARRLVSRARFSYWQWRHDKHRD